jgi:hypothetical protein
MIERLQNALGARGPLILTHHPHYLNIVGPESRRYNSIVSDILEDEARRHHVLFYDATTEFAAIHDGQRLNAVFRWPEDVYSHLTETGYVNYGYWLAQKVEPWLYDLAAEASPGAGLWRK